VTWIGPARPERERLGIEKAMQRSLAYPQSPVNNSGYFTMHTIVFATQKGGSGKSTLAIGLALAAKQAGHNVRLLETDPQGTLSNWQRRRKTESIVEQAYDALDIEPRLRALEQNGATLVIIDTAGGLCAATTAAIRHADLCIIPARPSVADIEASARTLGVIRAWKKPFAFVLNQAPIRGRRIDEAASTLGSEAERELVDVLAKPFIAMRNDHQDALAAGLAVSEFAPSGKSADEIRSLWRWLDTRLNASMMADAGLVGEFAERYPIELVPASMEAAVTSHLLPIAGEPGAAWDAGL
jgi:chromosome partitioning protein